MKKTAIALTAVLFLWGCATFSPSYKQGTEAALAKNWDLAVEYYERASLENPNNSVYRLALIRARLQASQAAVIRARALARQDKVQEALDSYEKALSYDPGNIRLAEEARRLASGEKPEREPEPVSFEPPVKLDVPAQPVELKFTEASLQNVYLSLGKTAGVNVLFDEQFRDKPISVELKGENFEDGLNSLSVAAKCFYTIVNPRTVIIIPDRPDKRLQYEINAIKTYYLSNIVAQDVHSSLLQLLRTQFRGPTIFVDKELNSVTIRDVPAVVELAGRILELWDKPQGEVVLDLELMEVSRQKIRQMGLDLDSHILGFGYAGEGGSETGWFSLKDIDFSKAENFQISLPTSILQFLETDADTKVIAQPRLRGIHGQEISYIVGDEIPVPQTTFQAIAAGGIQTQPVVNYDYKNVGIELKVTPTIHRENEVTLQMEIKIKALGGTGYANLPIISTREIKNVIRLKSGETNLLAGLLKDEERRTKKGIIGIKSLPILGDLFSSTDQNIQQTDVIMTITPYIIRSLPITDEDRKPLWINFEGGGSSSGAAGAGEEMMNLRPDPAEMIRQRQEAAAAAQTANTISLTPNSFEIPQGREFRLTLFMRSGEEVGTFSVGLSFDPGIVELKEIVEGGAVTQLGKDVPMMKNIAGGSATIAFSSPTPTKGLQGNVRIATLVFEAKEAGQSAVMINSVSATSVTGRSVAFETAEAQIRVR